MPAFNSSQFAWLQQGLLVVLVTGLVLALIVGLLLLTRPATLFALNERVSAWIDTSERFRRLEAPMVWERLFYRHHRIVGGGITLGAVYVLARRIFSYERAGLLGMLGPRWLAKELDWVVPALEWLVVGLHVLILGVGLVILFRPSLLKNLERAANQWHDVPGSATLDAVIGHMEPGFHLHPRLYGLILVVATSWCLGALLPVVLQMLGR
jgi:hypothetical protein